MGYFLSFCYLASIILSFANSALYFFGELPIFKWQSILQPRCEKCTKECYVSLAAGISLKQVVTPAKTIQNLSGTLLERLGKGGALLCLQKSYEEIPVSLIPLEPYRQEGPPPNILDCKTIIQRENKSFRHQLVHIPVAINLALHFSIPLANMLTLKPV